MLELKPGQLSFKDIDKWVCNPHQIKLSPTTYQNLNTSYHLMKKLAADDRSVYGINTGFGMLAHQHISFENLRQLQKNLVLSHAVGVGVPLEKEIVKLMMLLKINSLARGYSGVSESLIHTMVLMYNADIIPIIPSQGSVGASGDLAPLAYLAMTMMGLGDVKMNGVQLPAKIALEKAGIAIHEFEEKEGLSLLNGTQVSTAIGLYALLQTQRNFAIACISGALSLDAGAGLIDPFHPEIARLKNSQGQLHFVNLFNQLIADSQILQSQKVNRRVQDPYCLRCQPQVMGAIWDYLENCKTHLINEANAVSDNPLIFTNLKKALSGGNFHAESVAFSSDILAIVGSEIGAISERRIAFLIDKNMSGLPAFLVENSGLNSGFMTAHVTAAALASENKTYAHPASVDSIPTSGNQEDHVSMAPFAGMKCLKVTANVLHILAIELLTACQGLDFRKPLKTSPLLQIYQQQIRDNIPFYSEDRFLGADVKKMTQLIEQLQFYRSIYEQLFF